MGQVKLEELKKVRALTIINKIANEGKTHGQVAKEMGISTDTVARTLAWARTAQIFVEFEQRLYNELLPLAHAAVKGALEDGDAQIGLEILKGTQVLKKPGAQGQRAQQEEDDFYAEIARARADGIIDVTPRWAELESGGEAIGESSPGVAAIVETRNAQDDLSDGPRFEDPDRIPSPAQSEGPPRLEADAPRTQGPPDRPTDETVGD